MSIGSRPSRAQDIVDAKTKVNNTKWSERSSHMSMIAAPPACAELPERTEPALDVYFEKGDVVQWYTAQQASYTVVNSASEAADADLTTALQAYAVGLVQRDTLTATGRPSLRQSVDSSTGASSRSRMLTSWP